MKEPTKFFNLLIPYDHYVALRNLRRKTDVPIAELVRRGIALILEGAKGGVAKE